MPVALNPLPNPLTWCSTQKEINWQRIDIEKYTKRNFSAKQITFDQVIEANNFGSWTDNTAAHHKIFFVNKIVLFVIKNNKNAHKCFCVSKIIIMHSLKVNKANWFFLGKKSSLVNLLWPCDILSRFQNWLSP